MSSSPAVEQSPPTTTPPSPAQRGPIQLEYAPYTTSTPNYIGKRQHPPLNVILPPVGPLTPSLPSSEAAQTPPPRSPGALTAPVASGDTRQPVDGTSSDKSSETAVGGASLTPSVVLSRKESYKAQRQHYRREKKRAASALLHSIEDPSVVVLADWLKVRGSLKSWTKLWCVLKPGLLLLYKSPKAKSSHWVGTVLLTSCQVIERPSKKDGFCFKLYHPLEQSIWAPRGPHNETIGAVVQPLPTAHLIFRAPSQAAGHCWLDGLELALRCSNAMLRCSRSRTETSAAAEGSAIAPAHISHEELERHFNEHDGIFGAILNHSATIRSPTDKDSVSLCSMPRKRKERKFLKYLSPTASSFIEEGMTRLVTSLPKRILRSESDLYSKTCSAITTGNKVIVTAPSDERVSIHSSTSTDDYGIADTRSLPSAGGWGGRSRPKTVSESGRTFPNVAEGGRTYAKSSDFGRLSSSGSPRSERFANTRADCRNVAETGRTGPNVAESGRTGPNASDKFCLIDYGRLPSSSFEALKSERREDRCTMQRVYVAGKVVAAELAGAASDSDSEVSLGAGATGALDQPLDLPPDSARQTLVQLMGQLDELYVEDAVDDTGAAGELVEEVTEENKSLIWFLLKQVRPGMDLSKVVLPTFILEPRSFLDKLSDNYYHADILASASQTADPLNRFKTVLRWYLSGLYKKPKGLKKPYNPVLGEVFRCRWKHPESGTCTYYIAEQVSHHPPVSAFYISNRSEGYVIEGSLLARSKFFGNSTSAILEGSAKIYLPRWGEVYVTTAPYAHCKGIVIGTLSMELGGKVTVACQENGYNAEIEFKLRSFLGGSDQTNAVSGRIKRGREVIASLDGYWDGRIDIKDKRTGEESVLLDVSQLKCQRLKRSLVRLERQQEQESQKLWIGVSEAILNDDQIAATEQKTIIEEAQRARTKALTSPWVPRLFHKDPLATLQDGVVDQGWRYNHTNTSLWEPEDLLEYEDEFVVKTLRADVGGGAPGRTQSGVGGLSSAEPRVGPSKLTLRASDSDSRDGLTRRTKTSARNLKQSLYAMDSAIREQTQAIERLSKTVDKITEVQRQSMHAMRAGNAHIAQSAISYMHLFYGLVLALVLQGVLHWLFYRGR